MTPGRGQPPPAPAAIPASWPPTIILDQVASTSDICVARAQAGASHGTSILARRQTHGRGTHGRHWTSLDGNLNLSIILRPDIPTAQAGHYALLSGLAVLTALTALTPAIGTNPRLQLKWPNDVLLEGGKLAGVLIQSAARPDATLDWLVVGIGVNLLAAPTIPGRLTASLAQYDPPDPPTTAAAIIAQLHALAALPRTHLHAAWLAHAHPIGTPLRIGTLQGRFAGLGRNGALLLDDGTLHEITTGEVELPAPACLPIGSHNAEPNMRLTSNERT